MPEETVRRFFKSQAGSYAVVFALLSLPLMGMIGLMADYGRAESLRSRLHSATDAAVIAAAQDWVGGKTSGLEKRARDFLLANLGEKYSDDLKMHLRLPSSGDRTMQIKASIQYRPLFGPLLAGISGGDAGRFDYIIE